MPLLRPCAECGEVSEQAYCTEHRRKQEQRREPRQRAKAGTRARGYGWEWQQLSARARAAQPFCNVLGCTDKDLTVDHTPQAWQRIAEGKPVRLEDIEVLCRTHNSSRGKARLGALPKPQP